MGPVVGSVLYAYFTTEAHQDDEVGLAHVEGENDVKDTGLHEYLDGKMIFVFVGIAMGIMAIGARKAMSAFIRIEDYDGSSATEIGCD